MRKRKRESRNKTKRSGEGREKERGGREGGIMNKRSVEESREGGGDGGNGRR